MAMLTLDNISLLSIVSNDDQLLNGPSHYLIQRDVNYFILIPIMIYKYNLSSSIYHIYIYVYMFECL